MKKILFLLSFFATLHCFGTTYYIDPSGNNAAAGAIGTPWATLVYACAHTASGDIIHVNAGTYTETAQCFLPIGVSVEGVGVTSIIKSSAANTVFTSIIYAASGTQGTDGNQHISNLKFDGQSQTSSIAISFRARKNISVYNCTIVDFQFAAIGVSGYTTFFSDPSEPTIYATGCTIHDNIVTNCAGYDNWGGFGAYGSGSLNIVGTRGMVVYNNDVQNMVRADGFNGWPIKAQNFNDSLIIHNNTLYRKAFPYASNGATDNGIGDYWDFAIETGDCRGCEIYANDVRGSVDFNRSTKGSYAFSVWVHDNVIGFPTVNLTSPQCGVILEFVTTDAIIERNTIRNNTEGITFRPNDTEYIRRVVIRRNLISNVGGPDGTGAGIRIYSGSTFTINDLKILNNTITANGGGHCPFWGMDFSYPDTADYLLIKNNIMQGFNIGGACIVSHNLARWRNCQITYNNFYDNSNTDDPFPSWVEPVSNFPVSSTYSNTIKTIPGFVGSGDYTLALGSLNINAGTNVGLSYVGGAPDIGYSEYGSDVIAPTVTTTLPANGATGVLITSIPVITFSEALDPATVTTGNISISPSVLISSLVHSSGVVTMTLGTLSYSTTYTVTVGTGVTDVAGNAIAAPYTFSFTTGAAPVIGPASGKVIVTVTGAKAN